MTISISSQDTVSVVENGGNPNGDSYVRLRLDNGYECMILYALGSDAINNIIQKTMDDFNSDIPPINWFTSPLWSPSNGWST